MLFRYKPTRFLSLCNLRASMHCQPVTYNNSKNYKKQKTDIFIFSLKKPGLTNEWKQAGLVSSRHRCGEQDTSYGWDSIFTETAFPTVDCFVELWFMPSQTSLAALRHRLLCQSVMTSKTIYTIKLEYSAAPAAAQRPRLKY